jgi:type VI secretion system protein ImpH
VQDKFQIRLTVAGLSQFEQFLPGGGYFDKLVDLVYFYVGDLLEYEVRLLLPAEDAQPVKLGSFGRLGWTTWMRDDAAHPTKPLLDDCSFHPAERAAEKRRRLAETLSPRGH